MRGNTGLAAFAALVLAASLAACDGSPVDPGTPARPSSLMIEGGGDGGGGGGGGGSGGGTTTPDFSTFPSTITPNVTADPFGSTSGFIQGCAQVPHVWVAPVLNLTSNGIYVVSITQGTTIYFTGVVDPNTKVKFAVYNAAGQLVMTHLTNPARDNCVVHHEPEARSTSGLPQGNYYVFAAYWTYHSENFNGIPVLVENAVNNQYVAGIFIQ